MQKRDIKIMVLVAIVLLLCPFINSVSANQLIITSWSNSVTNDNSTNITIDVGETIRFSVSTNQENVSWNWIVDGEDQGVKDDTFTHNFERYGIYKIGVYGNNMNNSTQMISWNATVVLSVTDDLDYTINLSKKPERIISLSPSNTEILFALGLDSSIVGVTDFCNYPANVAEKDSVGSFTTPNAEEIVKLNPDLIIASYGNDMDVLTQLRSLNLTIFCLNPLNMDDIVCSITTVGMLTQEGVNASVITEDMNRRIGIIGNETDSMSDLDKPRALYIVWYDPMFVAGNETYADDLITKAGGINIVSEVDGWKEINIESILDKNPHVIICSGMGGGSYTIRDSIMNDTILSQTDAVKNGRVYPIEDPNTIERAGPRIVDGLEAFYDLLVVSTNGEDPSGIEPQPEQLPQNEPEKPVDTEDRSIIVPVLILALAMVLLTIYIIHRRRNA